LNSHVEWLEKCVNVLCADERHVGVAVIEGNLKRRVFVVLLKVKRSTLKDVAYQD